MNPSALKAPTAIRPSSSRPASQHAADGVNDPLLSSTSVAVSVRGSAAGGAVERVVEVAGLPSLHAQADDTATHELAAADAAAATTEATPQADKAAPSAALAAALPGGRVIGATIPTKLRNLNSTNSNKHGTSSFTNKNKRTRYAREGRELAHRGAHGVQSVGGFATGRTDGGASDPRLGSSSLPSSSSSKRSKKTKPITAQPHYRCARSTYESSAAASVFSSDMSQHPASLRFMLPAPQPPQVAYALEYQQQMHASASSLWQASSESPELTVPLQTPSLAAQRVRHLLAPKDPRKDVPFTAPTLEALLLRQKQTKQKQPLVDQSQPAVELMGGSSSGTVQGPQHAPSLKAAAPSPSVVSLADLSQKGTLLKPRRTSPAALPSDFAPSKVDVVLELLSDSANHLVSSSVSSSDASSSAAAPANACRRFGSAPAFEALLNRHLVAYIQSTRRSRSHLIDHLLALVEQSGGLFCRVDKSCHRWIQVGYETSFDVCASEFKAVARDVLKRIQLLRSLERQEHEFAAELVHEHLSEVQLPRSIPTTHSEVLHMGHELPPADSQTVHPKAPPGPLPRPPEADALHRPPTARTNEPQSSRHRVTGSVTFNPVPPRPISSRERKLQAKFKRPKMKAPPSTPGADSASCERAIATRPTSPMPRRVTNEQESNTSANI